MGRGGCQEVGDGLFSVVPSDSTRGNRHKPKHRRFHLKKNNNNTFFLILHMSALRLAVWSNCPRTYCFTHVVWGPRSVMGYYIPAWDRKYIFCPTLASNFIFQWLHYWFLNKILEPKNYSVFKSKCAENLTAVGKCKKSTFH